ncbi:MAG: ABC transporter permease, partial [Aurantimonas coralicida]
MKPNLRILLPVLSLALLLGAVFVIQPRTMSYLGLNLLFNLAVPIALATVAQMIIIMVNDIDLSVGTFVSFVACVTATWLNDAPLIGAAILAASVLAYAGLGALIQARGLPSIVVTLGMSFVWAGLALMILPSPGGASPGWLRWLMTAKPPVAPMAIVASVLIAGLAHLLIMRSSFGTVLRGFGGNERTLARAGWSLIRLRASAYALSAVFGILSGMTLVGLSTAADANI